MSTLKYTSLLALLFFMVTLVACKKELISTPKQDPVSVFEYLWKTMDTKYAMFGYKKVNWKGIYNQYRPMVSATTSPDELFSICSSMLDSLKDGHVSLSGDGRQYSYNGYYLSYTHNFNYEQLKGRYLINAGVQGALTFSTLGKAGYVYIPSFSKSLTKADINYVFKLFENLDSLIIDVRDNTGGESAMVDFLTAKLITDKTLFKYDIYKKGPAHDNYFDRVPKYISPSGPVFTGKPIVVLTNRRCFSSCNDFVLYMSLSPNVTLIGDQTGGGGGTPFHQELPNNWLLKYSASMAISPDGYNIEGGIKPDIAITNSLEDESHNRDAILEAALKYLEH